MNTQTEIFTYQMHTQTTVLTNMHTMHVNQHGHMQTLTLIS